ncbi:MAG: MMPL family transporter [Dehalococcoidia bacterium]|nr:MMPL family transporter [Dehalococcoidia bacterium]
MLFRLGVFMVRWRWLVIAAWAAAFLASGVFAPRAISELKAGFGRADTEAQRGLDVLQEKLGQQESVFAVVFQHPSLRATDTEYRTAMEQTLAPLAGMPQVERVITLYNSGITTLASDDGKTSYALVVLTVSIDEAMNVYPDLRRQLQPPPGFQIWATGGIPIFASLNAAAEEDLRRAETLSLPLVLAALLVIFGTLVATALPIAMAALTIVITMALVYLLAQVMEVSIFVLNIASFLGIGIAVDYTLLVVNRFREELSSHDRSEAIGITMATAGRAILFSGLTTVVGLTGMFFIPLTFFSSMALGGVTVVLVSVLAVMTLVPAVLGVLGPAVNRLRILRISQDEPGVWRRVAHGVMRHPILVAVPVTVFLVLLGTPFLGVKIGAPWATVLPADAEPRQGWEIVEEALGPGALSPVAVVVQAPAGILDPQTIGALYDFTHKLAQDPRVERVESIVTLAPGITREQYQQLYAALPGALPPQMVAALKELLAEDVTLVRVVPRVPPFSGEGKALVRDIREQDIGPGIEVLVTGATADIMDTIDLMYGNFPYAVLYIVVVTYIVLLVLFRSVVLPLKAVIMNALSILASYGALVYIFQQGHFQGLLGFQADGYTETTVPIILFCILFGLSMDYEVFLLSRIKEVYDETADNTNSVALGLERTGRIITSAAAVLVLVAAAFATSDVIVVKAFGVGTAIAILVDATLVRALLVPALMRIMGRWNWWAPRWLLRLLPEQRMAM